MREYLENTDELKEDSTQEEVEKYLDYFCEEVISDKALVKMLYELTKQYPDYEEMIIQIANRECVYDLLKKMIDKNNKTFIIKEKK